jgi:hypothetical protein
MVENFAESLGMCSDCPGRALIKILKRGLFSLREGKRKKIGSNCLRWRKGRSGWVDFIPRPETHPRATRADSPRHPRGRSVRHADGPGPRRGRSVKASRTSGAAPLPHEPRGRSALPWRTVRQEQPDGPPS